MDHQTPVTCRIFVNDRSGKGRITALSCSTGHVVVAATTDIPVDQLQQNTRAATSGYHMVPTHLRHPGPERAVRCKHPVVAGQIYPRPWYQRRQPRHEIQRFEDVARVAVAVWGLQLIANITRRSQRQVRLGNCRPGDVTAQRFQLASLVACGGHPGMQRKKSRRLSLPAH